MTHTIHLYGAKGGVGTSTVAAMVALDAADAGYRVHLRADDFDTVADLRVILGLPAGEIALMGPADGPRLTVFDHGTTWPAAEDGETYLVTRACYLALRRAVGHRPDGVILLEEAGRALDGRDVAEVIGAPIVATIPVSPDIARAIDAGILATSRRRPQVGIVAAIPSAVSA